MQCHDNGSFYNGLYTSNGTNGFNFRAGGDCTVLYVYGDGGQGVGANYSPPFADGQWHKIDAVYTASNISVYVDGTLSVCGFSA